MFVLTWVYYIMLNLRLLGLGYQRILISWLRPVSDEYFEFDFIDTSILWE